jgi:hypothetical protein
MVRYSYHRQSQKAKFTLHMPRKPRVRVEVSLYSFFNFGARWGGWSTPRPGRLTPGKYPVSIVSEGGWASGPDWSGAENLASTRIRSPHHPARSESLYRLSYRGPLTHVVELKKPAADNTTIAGISYKYSNDCACFPMILTSYIIYTSFFKFCFLNIGLTVACSRRNMLPTFEIIE